MQPLQICIGPSIRIGRESWCLPYAGFFNETAESFNVISFWLSQFPRQDLFLNTSLVVAFICPKILAYFVFIGNKILEYLYMVLLIV